jgi:hypothetical protein
MFMTEKEVSDYLYVITKAWFQHTVMYPAGVEEEWLQRFAQVAFAFVIILRAGQTLMCSVPFRPVTATIVRATTRTHAPSRKKC